MYENLVKLYCNKKQLLIFIMGISSGIPLYLILSTLFIWLARENVDISTIGLFALTQIPWSLKFCGHHLLIITKYLFYVIFLDKENLGFY